MIAVENKRERERESDEEKKQRKRKRLKERFVLVQCVPEKRFQQERQRPLGKNLAAPAYPGGQSKNESERDGVLFSSSQKKGRRCGEPVRWVKLP
jgi:hypothetical protein